MLLQRSRRKLYHKYNHTPLLNNSSGIIIIIIIIIIIDIYNVKG